MFFDTLGRAALSPPECSKLREIRRLEGKPPYRVF